MKKIAFTGGGSAGHVVPNLALIDDVQKRGMADVCYFGTNGIEKGLVTDKHIPFYTIHCPKLVRGYSFSALKNNVKIPFSFHRAVKEAAEGLQSFAPDLVFSKGGYVSLPVVFAAKKLKIPCFTHESDLSAGLANKIIAKKCERIFTSFPETAVQFKNGKFSGAPIRAELFDHTQKRARKRLNIKTELPVLLVFGGGSGSKKINAALRERLPSLCKKYYILHLCGKGNLIHTNIKNYRQEEYSNDMGELYAAADYVVSRAGAGAIFEIIALKKPALFIPLEGQTRGDQVENAEYFFKKGLCRVVREENLAKLEDKIDALVQDSVLPLRVAERGFCSGNDTILRALAAYLK